MLSAHASQQIKDGHKYFRLTDLISHHITRFFHSKKLRQQTDLVHLSTNQRPVSRSPDHSWPIRGQYPVNLTTLDQSEATDRFVAPQQLDSNNFQQTIGMLDLFSLKYFHLFLSVQLTGEEERSQGFSFSVK